MRSSNSVLRSVAVALTMLVMLGAHAETADTSEIIAESARARLTLADYEAELAKLPSANRGDFAASALRLKQYLDNLYITRVLAADARTEGLDKDPVLSRQIAMQVDKVLAQAKIDRIEAVAAAEFDKAPDKYTARARELYEVNRARYAVPELVRAAHILVMVKEGKSDAARARAEEVRAKAVAGADFATLAREYSDDPSVTRNGGELGFFEAKAMDPAFAKAAFAMTRSGEVSPVVESKFGYHVILFEERRPARVRTFDEMKPDLMAEQKAKVIAEAKAEQTRRIFSDPTLKVNGELIERLNTESAIKSDTSGVRAPAKP